MKKRIIAMLLAVLFVLSLGATVYAEGSGKLVLSAKYTGEQAVVTVSVENAEGLTNGVLTASYNAQELELVSAKASDASAVASINTKTAGEVRMAWVGSKLTAEQTLMLTLEFSVKSENGSVVTASVSDAPMEIADGTVELLPYNPFVDIDGHWAEDDILAAYHKGLFLGISATEFVPEREMNRAMFVTTLYRLEGCPKVDISKLMFEDVPEDSYCTAAIVWAVEAGVTNGTGETTFEPWRSISREEIVTMLYRHAQYKGEDVTASGDLSAFPDVQDISTWATASMQWAVGEGLLIGYPDGTVRPLATATRAQAAAMLCRYAQ